MSDFPNGVQTRVDALRFLGAIAAKNDLKLGEWDIDDFSSIPHRDPVVETCRRKVLHELIPLLPIRDENGEKALDALVSELICELESDAPNR